MTEPTPGSLGEVWKAWQERKQTEGGEQVARQLAENYVDANRDLLEARYGHLTREECVQMVSTHRQMGNKERELELEVWLLSEFPPQNIGGRGEVVVRRGQRRG